MPAAAKPNKPPPVHNMSPGCSPERVTRYTYDVNKDKWTNQNSTVVLDSKTFEEGSMRAAFFMLDPTQPQDRRKWVAKMSKDPNESKKTYFLDVEMQALSSLFASEYNKLNPPKKVSFLEAVVLKCEERENKPLLAAEPWMAGAFEKYSNNYGFVSYDDRNTPQAFSHFTYCHSGGKLLICDIQGVGDSFTDPQIHSRDGNGFGKGNLGHKGMAQFFKTHQCNSICKYLNLPLVNPKANDRGTTAEIEVVSKRLSLGGIDPAQAAKAAPEGDAPPSPREDQMKAPPSNPLDLEYLGLTRDQFEIIKQGFERSANKTGRVDAAGLVKACGHLGYTLPGTKAREMMRELDQMDEGGLDLRQFVWWWCGVEE